MGRRTFPAGDEAGRRGRREAREQHADRLRDRGDGRGVLARAQVRRRPGGVLRGVHGRPVLGAGVQGLRQHHRESSSTARRASRPRSGSRTRASMLAAGLAENVPLPSLNVYRDKLLGRDGERRREQRLGRHRARIKRVEPASRSREIRAVIKAGIVGTRLVGQDARRRRRRLEGHPVRRGLRAHPHGRPQGVREAVQVRALQELRGHAEAPGPRRRRAGDAAFAARAANDRRREGRQARVLRKTICAAWCRGA